MPEEYITYITIAKAKVPKDWEMRTEQEDLLWNAYQQGYDKGFKQGWRAEEKHIKDGIDEGGKQ